MNRLTVLSVVIALSFGVAFAAPPANLSLRGIAEWTEAGQWIGSGTGALPAVATEGARYTDLSTPTAPIDYRSNGSSWVAISGAGGGLASGDVPLNASFTLSGLGEKNYANLDGKPTSASWTHSSLDGYSSTDGHGASQTITQRLQIGTGSADTWMGRTATGTLTIASYAMIPPTAATPTAPATGTLWVDEFGVLRFYSAATWTQIAP